MHLSVKQQLGGAFAVLVAIVVAMSLVALRDLREVNNRFADHVHGASVREAHVVAIRIAADQRAIAVRDMVLVPTDEERAKEKAVAIGANERLQKSLQALKDGVAKGGADITERDRAAVAAIERVEAAYQPVAVAIAQLAGAGQREEAIAKMNNECRPLLRSLLEAASDYMAYTEQRAREDVEASEAAYGVQRTNLIVISVLAALLATGLGWLITRRLMAALGDEPSGLSQVTQRVAAGDLSPVPGVERAPAGSVLASMGSMQQQLVGLIGQVRSSADSIAIASAQIAQGNNDLSSRTEQQASALQQTAASMDELGATVRQNADSARQANQLAQGASAVAVKGGEVVGQVVNTMREINDSSRRIADIISVIDGIAFQTNILALNAAVEAARAGEQGRGFAVVATEVRSLASRSAQAAKEIKGLIGTSAERVERGSALVDQAGDTMLEIVSAIKRVTDIMGEISTASGEQSEGVNQVGEAVTQIDQVTQQNAALVEESAAAAESMKLQAQRLVEAVALFRSGQGGNEPALPMAMAA